jgi:MFS family permease
MSENINTGKYQDSGMVYRYYTLVALLVIYIFNAMDRQILAILQEQIKTDLSLSDFQLGLLGGPAFVILYTTCQIPIARLAEKRNRVTIITLGAAAWSFATAVCGVVQNFTQMLFARIAVGIGEAACIPPSHSVISDYFPPNRRATAMAIYGLGVPLGVLGAAIGAGYIASKLDWRWAFILLGLPGIAAAVILKLTVREPAREASTDGPSDFAGTLKFLFAKPVFLHTVIGGIVVSTFTFSYTQFLVSYFMRSYGLDVAEASKYFGLIVGVGAMVGTLLGGFVTDQIRSSFPKLANKIPAIALATAACLYLVAFQLDALAIVVGVLCLAGVVQFLYFAPMFAAAQNAAEPRMRATASAVLITLLTLIGYGLGPPVVGFATDILGAQNMLEIGLNSELCQADPTLDGCAASSGAALKTVFSFSVLALFWSAVHFWISGTQASNSTR